MAEVTLTVKKRETGKQISKEYRRQGLVPGIFYSNGKAGLPILSDTLSLRPVVYTAYTRVVNLDIEGEEQNQKAVLKDISFDPVTEKILHFDLIGLTPGTKITVQVPIKLVGKSKGVMGGGVLSQYMYKVPITATPENLPERLELDINELGFGQTFKIDKLKTDAFEFAFQGNPVVCSCKAPRVATEVETEAAEETEEA